MAQAQLEFNRLPYQEEVVPVGMVTDVDFDRRIKLWNLLERAASILEVPEDYATIEDVAHAEPQALEKGLYVPKFGPLWKTAEGKVDVPQQFASEAAQNSRWLRRQGKNSPIPPPEITVIFPPLQAKPIGYYAKALGDRARTKTRAANIDADDRDEVGEKVGRSAHHQLESYLSGMSSLESQLISEYKILKSLEKDLRSHWRGHFKPRNLDKRRNEAEDTIHLTVETSAITLNMDDTAIKGLHKAIRYNLYGLSQNDQERMWRDYLILVGRHSAAKVDRVASCIRACRAEMDRYQPFIDRKAQKEAEEASE